MAKKKELIIMFCGREDVQGRIQYTSSDWISDFTEQEQETVRQSGIIINKTGSDWRGNYYSKLIKNKIWDNPLGFEILDYAISTSTASFKIELEPDYYAYIKIDDICEIAKRGDIHDGKIFAKLTFRSFGGVKYLTEIK